jgi:ribosomal protein L1
MKFTQYFHAMRIRLDRTGIQLEWIQETVDHPVKQAVQSDGRIRRWAAIPEAEGKYLRVILLADGETVHNAFFDRSYSDEN